MTQRLSFNSSNSGSQQSNKVVPLLDLNGLKQVEALHALLHFLELHRSKRKSCVDVSQCQNEDICNMVKAVLTNRKMIFEREEGLFWIRTRSGMSASEIERKYKNNNTTEEHSLPRALALRDGLQAALKQQMRGAVSVQSSSSSSSTGSSNGAQHQQQKKQDEITIKQQTDSSYHTNQIQEDKQQKSDNNNEKREDDNSKDDDEKSFSSFCQNEMERMQFAKALELSKTQYEREEQEFTQQLELAQKASALQSAQRQRDLEAQEQQDLELALTLSKQSSVLRNSNNTPREPNICLTPRMRRTTTTTTTTKKIVSREPTTLALLRPSPPLGREQTPPPRGQKHHHQQQPKAVAAVGRGMERDTLKSLLNAARTTCN